MAIMLRGNVIRVPAPAENGFIPFFESWEKALTPKTRVIVLNYPSNPTGAYPTREYLQKLQDLPRNIIYGSSAMKSMEVYIMKRSQLPQRQLKAQKKELCS